MGFSLKPPSWLRNLAKGVVGSITTGGGTTVARDPTGQITVSPSQPQAANPADAVANTVASIPGGWLTIAAIGVGAFLLLKKR